MSVSPLAHVAGLAVLSLALAGAALAVPYDITVERLAPNEFAPDEEQLTFSGGGRLDLVGGAIGGFSLTLRTLASVGVEDAVLTFTVDESDLVFATGLEGPPSPDLTGVVIGLGASGIASDGGEASFLTVGGPAALTLDFGTGLATAFCIGEDTVQCIRGGGGSSGLEGALTAAIIPLPATLPLALTALGGLALAFRRRDG
jgi:hypothetical protein